MKPYGIWSNYIVQLRGVTCGVAFCVLLLVGFLVTPGFVRILNMEYWLALRDQMPRIEELTTTIAKIDSEIVARTLSVESSKLDLSNLRTLLEKEVKVGDAG